MDENNSFEQEISKFAESLENLSKSTRSTESREDNVMDELIKTIRELGPEGLKEKAKTLTKAQRELLGEVLQKASSLDREMRMDTDHGGDSSKPQSAKEPLTEKKTNSEEGVDEWDEEFMQESNAQHKHQGGQDQNQGPGEWQGQMIKGENGEDEKEEEEDEKEDRKIAKEEADKRVKEHNKKMHKEDMKKADGPKEKSEYDSKTMGAKEEYEGKSKMEKKQGVPKGVDSAKHERCVKDVKKQGHNKSSAYAICNAALNKGEFTEEDLEKAGNYMSKIIKRMKERGMDRDKVMEALSKKGYDRNMAMKAWDNKDEAEAAGKKVDLDKKGEKVKGKKEKPMAKSEDAVEAKEEKVEKSEDAKKEESIQKSVKWGNQQTKLLGVSTRRGQNCHYSVADTIVEQDKKFNEFKKSQDVYYTELEDDKKEEKIEKSEDPNKKLGINEMVEKSLDMTQDKFSLAKANREPIKRGGFKVKSFEEEEIAKAFRMSPEEAKKVLGDDEDKS